MNLANIRLHCAVCVWRGRLLPNIATALRLARTTSVLVVHVITRYSRDKSDWPKAWRHGDRIWCLEGTDNVQILDQARPLPGEPVVVKNRFSGSYRTALQGILRERGIDTLQYLAWLTNLRPITNDELAWALLSRTSWRTPDCPSHTTMQRCSRWGRGGHHSLNHRQRIIGSFVMSLTLDAV